MDVEETQMPFELRILNCLGGNLAGSHVRFEARE